MVPTVGEAVKTTLMTELFLILHTRVGDIIALLVPVIDYVY